MFVLGLVTGIFFGALVGATAMAMMAMAKIADLENEAQTAAYKQDELARQLHRSVHAS